MGLSTLERRHETTRDRLLRVREADFVSPNRDESANLILDEVQEREIINISDYCLFKIPNKTYLLIRLVKNFAILNESTWKKTAYNKNSAQLNEANKSRVGFAAAFFAVRSEAKTLVLHNAGIGYVPISNDCKTIPAPSVFDGKRNKISENVYNAIKDKVKIV